MISHDDPWLAATLRRQPQLTEKALIDLVNGLEVIDDRLRCRSVPRPMVQRLWHAATGRSAREQYLIDVNLKAGLQAVTDWLHDLQAFQAKSDLALAAVAGKLAATRAELNDHVNALDAAFGQTIEEIHGRLDEMGARIEELDARDKAKSHLELLVLRCKEPAARTLPPVVEAFLAADQLWWGDFGRYCRLAQDAEGVSRLLDLARFALGDALAGYLRVGSREILAVEDYLNPIRGLDDSDGELVSYLASHGTGPRTPLMHAIAGATASSWDNDATTGALPLALSPLGISSRLLREGRVATAEVPR